MGMLGWADLELDRILVGQLVGHAIQTSSDPDRQPDVIGLRLI